MPCGLHRKLPLGYLTDAARLKRSRKLVRKRMRARASQGWVRNCFSQDTGRPKSFIRASFWCKIIAVKRRLALSSSIRCFLYPIPDASPDSVRLPRATEHCLIRDNSTGQTNCRVVAQAFGLRDQISRVTGRGIASLRGHCRRFAPMSRSQYRSFVTF